MTSAVAMAWVWRWFYQPVPIGLFNNFLAAHRHPAGGVPALDHQCAALILAPAVWAGLGFQIIIFMAGPAGHSAKLLRGRAHRRRLEPGRCFSRSPFRCLRSTIVFLVVFSSIGFLRIFDHVFNMTTNDPGGPLNSTKPLVLMIYDTAFTSFRHGLRGGADGGTVPRPSGRQPSMQLRLLRDS